MPLRPELDGILADLVLKRGLAKPGQVREAVDLADGRGGKLGDALVELGYLTEIELRDLVGEHAAEKRITIGGFDIIEKVGQGGMGAVYRAKQVSLDREVALKLLPRDLASDQEYVNRFIREARASAKLNHLNIVQGIDVGEADGYCYFAMEFVDGYPVARRVRHQGPIPEKEAIDVTLQIARALQHADANGIVHRDVKPDNIMLDRHGTAKLCDLGLVTVPDEETSKAGVAIGTPNYISPEQARGEEDIDTRADIYGLGASAYHMVAGRTMFAGSSQEVLAKHVADQAPSPKESVAGVSDQFCFVLEKMLAKRRNDRYQTPAELIEDLERLAAGAPVHAARFSARSSIELTPRTVDTAAIGRRVSARRPQVRRSEPMEPVAAGKAAGLFIAGGLGLALIVGALIIFTTGKKAGPGEAREPGPGGRVDVAEPPGAAADAGDPAKEMFEYVEEFLAKSPGSIPEAAAKYRNVASSWPQSPWGQKARERADELEQSLEEALELAMAGVSSLAERGSFAEAVAACDDLLQRYGGTEPKKRLTRLKEETELAALQELAAIVMKAFGLATEKGDFAKAERMLKAAKEWKIARVDQKVDERIAQLAKRKADLDLLAKEVAEKKRREIDRKRLDRYNARLKQSRDLFAQAKYTKAQGPLKAVLADRDLSEHHGRTKAALEKIADAAALAKKAGEALGNIAAGTKLQLRGRRGIPFKGTVQKAEPGAMTVRGRSGAMLVFGLADLAPEDMSVLAVACSEAEGAARLRFAAAVMLAGADQADRAKGMIALALASRPSRELARRIRALSDELAAAENKILEEDARALIEKLRGCAESKDHAATLSGYRILKSKYAKTRAFSDAANELEGMAAEARLALANKPDEKEADGKAEDDPAKIAKAAREKVLRQVRSGDALRTLRGDPDKFEYCRLLSDIEQLVQGSQELDKYLKSRRDDWSINEGRVHWQLCKNYVMLGRSDLAEPMRAEAEKRTSEDWFRDSVKKAKDWIAKYPEHVKSLDAMRDERTQKGPSADLQWRICEILNEDIPRPLDERAELEAMVRCYPDHEDVKSGEAHWRLIERFEGFREFTDIIKHTPGHVKDHPEHWSVKDGEADWRLAEAYRELKIYKEALKYYQDVMRNHRAHWSVTEKTVEERIRECNRNIR